MDSIIETRKRCYICGSHWWIEEHHIFGGANRKKSEQYGLKVYLCHCCHNEPPNGVHHNKANMDALRAEAQGKAMEYYGWTEDDFRKLFGKSYL